MVTTEPESRVTRGNTEKPETSRIPAESPAETGDKSSRLGHHESATVPSAGSLKATRNQEPGTRNPETLMKPEPFELEPVQDKRTPASSVETRGKVQPSASPYHITDGTPRQRARVCLTTLPTTKG